jgi:hypothetical protein
MTATGHAAPMLDERAEAIRERLRLFPVSVGLSASTEARAVIAEQAAELTRLRALVEEMQTPDIYGDAHGRTVEPSDIDEFVDGDPYGTIREVWATRDLGLRWVARVACPPDDSRDDETETRIFESHAEAVAAVEAARTAPRREDGR